MAVSEFQPSNHFFVQDPKKFWGRIIFDFQYLDASLVLFALPNVLCIGWLQNMWESIIFVSDKYFRFPKLLWMICFFCTSKFSIKRLMTSKNQQCLFQPNMFGLHNFSSSLILFTLPKLACKGRLQNKQESTVFSLMSNLAHCVLFLWSKSKVFID